MISRLSLCAIVFYTLQLLFLSILLLLCNQLDASAQVSKALPPTCMDSFVHNAGDKADLIYGDEGIDAEPPFHEGFTAQHRINSGITGQENEGLTTGHSERLPDAWGRDEFLGQEWSVSGASSGSSQSSSIDDLPTTRPPQPSTGAAYNPPLDLSKSGF